MPVLESVVALKAVVGIAGVASALFVNRDSSGNFKFDEIPKAIFGEAIGGIYADFFKEGIGSGYANLKAKYEQISLDKDTLNHDLQKAARKAQLIATFFAAQYCLEQIRAENSSAETFAGKTLERAKGLVVTDNREAYLKEVIKYLNDEIKNVDKAVFSGTLSFDEFVPVFDTYRQTVESGSQSSVSESLKEDIIREFEILSTFPDYKFDRDAFSLLAATIQTGWEELPPERVLSEHFVTLDISALGGAPGDKKYDWFYLVCSIFNEEYKSNPRVEAAAQKQLLLKIVGELQTFGTLNTKIPDLINQISNFADELRKIGEGVERIEAGVGRLESGQTKIENLVRQIVPEQPNPQNLVALPSLDDKVYGRKKEIELLKTFLEHGKRNGVFVAPTCFGKTYLIKKFLWTIVEIGGIKNKYRRTVEKVIYLDCRERRSMTEILQLFANMLGTKLDDLHFLADLFTKIQAQKILLIFDNFESWIDENGNYAVGSDGDGKYDESIKTFLGALFGSNHNIRGIFISQKIPDKERDFRQVERLDEISRELEEGLEPDAALELAQKEGARVGLGEVAPEALQRFFERVYYIPQAIQSMIGYLETVGESFAVFERDFWEDFDREERDDQNIENRLKDKLRPTKALIKRQIAAQNETTKFLLSLLAFFGVSVPKEVLVLSLSAIKGIENAAERSRAVKILIDNRLAKTEADLVRERDAETGAEEQIIYFTLHPYLREIVRGNQPAFETENGDALEPFAYALFNLGNDSAEKTYFRKATGFYECAEKIFEWLVFNLKREDLLNDLAGAYLNKGVVLDDLQRLDEAVLEYEKSIEIVEQLVKRENKLELRNDLAMAYMNKGVALANLQRLDEAVLEYEKSIEIREQLVKIENKLELRNDLAAAYLNKGNALWNLQRLDDAIKEYDKAINLWAEENALHNLPNLIKGLRNKNILLIHLNDWQKTAENALRALTFDWVFAQPSLPPRFKELVKTEIDTILRRIKKLDDADKEAIYQHAGAGGENLRKRVDEV